MRDLLSTSGVGVLSTSGVGVCLFVCLSDVEIQNLYNRLVPIPEKELGLLYLFRVPKWLSCAGQG